MTDWNIERTTLRGYFTLGTITKATRKELEHYLVVLANSTDSKSSSLENSEAERFAVVIKHLLDVKISEELHEKSVKTSKRAFWLSIAAITVSLLMPKINGTWYVYSAYHNLPSKNESGENSITNKTATATNSTPAQQIPIKN